ncbi:anaphase-promoting complex subunit 10 isoform X3 [Sminthopsis crassicaudata]|uniref:anaphase-promoting complex subunit 10 isoform X3 n=1 Tax=Sminthopsis crassicaudata TaxID=9301 RepID=UPI003D698EAB
MAVPSRRLALTVETEVRVRKVACWRWSAARREEGLGSPKERLTSSECAAKWRMEGGAGAVGSPRRSEERRLVNLAGLGCMVSCRDARLPRCGLENPSNPITCIILLNIFLHLCCIRKIISKRRKMRKNKQGNNNKIDEDTILSSTFSPHSPLSGCR